MNAEAQEAQETHAAAKSATPTYCGQCGGPIDEGTHEPCAARLELEPPRYCGQCARRMVVQVLPGGWIAHCSRHGSVSDHQSHPPRVTRTSDM
ncbi:hypothetical protein [Actinocrinis sp.]|uniref:biotin synthase auxiliary protein BsaP n=1 Tax=Actinocrinis sp. TaxID=1920516 RepID=UPI002DDCDDC4|nr:hypothetical protein [Actinocrinis sp.]